MGTVPMMAAAVGPSELNRAGGQWPAEPTDEMPTHNGFIHFKEDAADSEAPEGRPRAMSH